MSSPRPPPDEHDGERGTVHEHDASMTTTSAPDLPTQHAGETSSTSASNTATTNNGDDHGAPTSQPLATAIPTTPPASTTTPPIAGPSSTSPPAAAAPAGAGPTPTSGTPSSPSRRRSQRPLSSVSFFLPFGGQQAGPDGPQVGLTWTLEVFGNDGTEEESAGPAPNAHPPEATPDREPAGADGTPEAQNPPSPGANGNPNPTAPGPGPNPQPHNPEREGATRSIFFIVGPDGTMRRGDGAVDDAAAPPFPFPFPFAFPFQPGPPPPDPAKAAELLNSLPTVGRALLKRVDKVLTAEDAQRGDSDSSGWQCGICLEGFDVGQPVKGLPCNHLFHEACLQPWFTNHHHTCPTCRLDLDPLRTLHEPARRAPLRPTTTGSGRGTPAARAAHPYARPGTETNGANAEGRRSRPGSNAPTQPGTPQNERNEPAGDRDRLEVPMNPLDVAFDIARMLGLPIGSPTPMREGEQRREEEGEGERNVPEEGPAAGPSTAPGENAPAEQPAQSPPHDGLPRPTPERRRHITIFHVGGDGGAREETQVRDVAAAPPQGEGAEAREGTPATAPEAPADAPPAPVLPGATPAWPAGLFGFNPLAGAPMDWPTFLAGGGPRTRTRTPTNLETPAAAGTAPANARTPAGTQPAEPAPPPSAGAAPPASAANANGGDGANAPNLDGAGADGNNEAAGTFRLPIELLFFRPPPGGAGGPAEVPAPQPENQPPAAPQQTFVPQSLESWTAQREKGLGWRCDAVECLVAPPVPDADTMDVDDEPEDVVDPGDKEMLAIYAENQAPFPPRENPGDEPHSGHEFVLLACPHRWHRACLETAARSAGHSTVPDASGREWVRCARCRKEGWIVPRESEPAAAAVEAAM